MEQINAWGDKSQPKQPFIFLAPRTCSERRVSAQHGPRGGTPPAVSKGRSQGPGTVGPS